MKPLDSDAASAVMPDLTRRRFLRTTAATGVALSYSKMAAHAQSTAAAPSDVLNVALVGCGSQGDALKRCLARITGIKVAAVCDLWESRRRQTARALGVPEAQAYERIEDMLAKQPEIDCVVLAVPDYHHAPYSRLALEAGKHVYCEKMMSNTLEAASDMVRAQRQSGKLLQIGHQRRSNPRYILMRDRLLKEKNLLGQVTHLYGQWNRSVKPPFEPKSGPPPQVLKDHGYDNMFQYSNWRWLKKYGGGPISDLGAHQIDIFNWLLGTTPSAMIASGGLNYFVDRELGSKTGRFSYEHLDNAIVTYEYQTEKWGLVRATYQVLTTNGSQNYYEKVMGVEGTIVISEEQKNGNQVYREKDTTADKLGTWEGLVKEGLLRKPPATVYNKFWERPKAWNIPDKWLAKEGTQDVRVSIPADPYELPAMPKEMDEKPAHQFHLENFFNTVRAGGKQTDLNCPVEEAYKCAVAVLNINKAVATGQRIEFQPSDFTVA